MYKLLIGSVAVAAICTLVIEGVRSAGKSDQPNFTTERLENIDHVRAGNWPGIFIFKVLDPGTKEVTMRHINVSNTRNYKVFVDVPEGKPMWVEIWRNPHHRDPKNIRSAELHIRCSSGLKETKNFPSKCSGS